MNIFTYGSLMFPDVWTRVVRGAYRASPASAAGYRRFAVRGQTYPGMIAVSAVESAGVRVEGVVYFDVDARDVSALDAFEGEDYRRQEIAVVLPDDSAVVASTYIYHPVEVLTEDAWNAEEFLLEEFLKRHCGHLDEPGGDTGDTDR